ncbi:MAG: undecaprenyl-diphosphate phosphatase [Alphaproteobacteria bacterium]
MAFFELVVTALVQGASVVLPVSAATHGMMLRAIFAGQGPTPAVEAAMHLGCGLALAVVLSQDIWRMTFGLFQAARGRRDPGARLALNVLLASAPLLIAGMALDGSEIAAEPANLGLASIVFGVLLYLADRLGMTIRRMEHMRVSGALAMGAAQLLALVPGAGRSSVTVMAARFLGYERVAAARFSLLIAIPVTFALAGRGSFSAQAPVDGETLIAGGIAFIASLAAASALLTALKRERFTPYALYRVLLGAGLLAWAYMPAMPALG